MAAERAGVVWESLRPYVPVQSCGCGGADTDECMADDLFGLITARDGIDTCFESNLSIMCFDYEGGGGDMSEFGFAWCRMADLISVALQMDRGGLGSLHPL